METPLAVSVVTQEQMALRGLSRISDVSSLVPNLVVGNSGEDSGVSIAIRGVSSNNYTELGDPTVAIHVDGMYTPCLLYTSPSPRDGLLSRMPSSA